ncbi:MAG: TolC family protein [Planctomycetota bacterium]
MERIDRRTNERLRESAEALGGGAIYPELESNRYENGSYFAKFPEGVDRPGTVNPPASDLKYESTTPRKEDAASIAARFERLKSGDPETRIITFEDAIASSLEGSEEYLFAEEAYLTAAIRLLIEEHRWGVIPTNISSANFSSSGQGGRFDNALGLVNSLGVSQRLPYGGEVSAAFVVAATEQLDNYLSDTDTQSADIVIEAAIPLLRGAGDVAQESLIQARRNLVYAAREFEQFRRDYFYDLAADYLTLVVQLQSIANGVRQVERSAAVEARTKALVESGRTEPFQADLATQNTLFALDRLTSQREAYVLSLDRFKRRIGIDIAEKVDIDPVQFNLPPPLVNPSEALATAFRFRLDLQTAADRVDDFNRRVAVARNNQLGDLDLVLANNLPTDPTKDREGLAFDPGYDDFSARLVFAMPLDRTKEDLELREAQIEAEQAMRRFETARDDAAVQVRQAARGIERSQFSLAIQEKNVQASMNRQAAIDAAPDRATARDRTEAVDALRRAQDDLARARRDLQLAILRYLNTSGQMRVSPEGRLIPLPGMDLDQNSGPGIAIDQG